jgi:hypothetical protein
VLVLKKRFRGINFIKKHCHKQFNKSRSYSIGGEKMAIKEMNEAKLAASEVAEVIFIDGYRLGGHVPWVSLHPAQVALMGKLFTEKK